jgi:amidase
MIETKDAGEPAGPPGAAQHRCGPEVRAASSADAITELGGLALSAAIHAREVSCREVMAAYLDRIARLNPRVNAIVNQAPAETLLVQADACDAELARGASRGWLHGMPQAIKDVAAARGFPTTMGCTLLADAVAREDGVVARRMKGAGCIVVGKTNVPEFGLGSHTFNSLFGATRNAWDPAVSAGGSSGGAAVALALHLLPVADGSDFMGSLRNPAAWNNVFGLRPSWGRVPNVGAGECWVSQLGTEGPMARSVADLAALLATQAGADPRVPLALADDITPLLDLIARPAAAWATGAALVTSSPGHAPEAGSPAQPGPPLPPGGERLLRWRELKGLRIAWLGDMGGHLATEGGIVASCESALRRFEAAGAAVEPVAPGFNLDSVWQAWLVWRVLISARVGPLLARPGARAAIKPEAQWEHDQAQGLSFADFMRASERRSAWYQHLLGLFERFDVLALPATQVWPFPVGDRWPRAIAGRTMDTYHRWMEVTIYATLAGLPAISVPAAFHANGRWPAGLQLIGRPRDDAGLLAIAAGYETSISELLARRPAEPAAP